MHLERRPCAVSGELGHLPPYLEAQKALEDSKAEEESEDFSDAPDPEEYYKMLKASREKERKGWA
eukprot:6659843-Pyramimonas_sp.AAC.1